MKKTKVKCKFFEQGNCRAGDKCKFFHDKGQSQLKVPEPTAFVPTTKKQHSGRTSPKLNYSAIPSHGSASEYEEVFDEGPAEFEMVEEEEKHLALSPQRPRDYKRLHKEKPIEEYTEEEEKKEEAHEEVTEYQKITGEGDDE